MADENDDWFAAADEPEAAPAAAAAAGGDDAAAGGAGGGDDAPALEAEEALEEEEEPTTKRGGRKLDRPLLFKAWKRPVFLQYSYLYDYRHNYYDDVIDYLDRRQRGIHREIPRAQTWAERALRTYTTKSRQSAAYERRERDINLLSDMRTSARFYNYHSKDYMNTKYASLLY